MSQTESKKKNIAFVTSDLKSGGSERVASRLTSLFGDRYNNYYIVFNSEDISYEINAELIDLNVPPTDNKAKKVVNTFKRAAGIRRAVREHDIDVLFSFTTIANRAMLFSRANCKKIGACRGYEDLMLHPANYHRLIRFGSKILFNSRESEEYYLAKYPGDAAKCVTIENLFDIGNIREMAKEELSPEHAAFFASHKTLTTVGILSRHKGHWDLLKSFEILKEKVPDAGLVIVGHRGLLEKQIKEMAANNKYREDILFTGYQSNPFKFLAKSDVYVHSSISEGFPNAIIEAMACGAPCVSTACATGPCEIMFDEYRKVSPKGDYVIADNGVLTPVFDGIIDYDYSHKSEAHEVFAAAAERLLSDKELAVKLARAGAARADRCDEAMIADKYFELIEGEEK